MLFTGTFEVLAALSVVFRFFQYIPTALAVLVLRKKYPDKSSLPRSIWPSNPNLAVLVSLVKDLGENPMNYIYGLIGVLSQVVYYIYILILENKVLE